MNLPPFVDHPAFQSLVLPALLALLATAALSAWSGARWAPLGAVLGLIGALAWLPGFDWPAASRVQKLPWIVLAGLALAVAAMALPRAGERPRRAWWVAVPCWAGACVWLVGAQGSVPSTLGIGVAGVAVLCLLGWAPLPGSAASAAPVWPGLAIAAGSLTVAALGLAALAAGGGSLLLAQLALMLATCTAVFGLWFWLRPAAGGHEALAALMPLGVAGLALAVSWALSLSPTTPAAFLLGILGLLALALAVPPLLSRSRWARAHPRWTPGLAALLAALPVAAALAWQFGAGVETPPDPLDDDPYYTPG